MHKEIGKRDLIIRLYPYAYYDVNISFNILMATVLKYHTLVSTVTFKNGILSCDNFRVEFFIIL